jgi:hypothetical protein
LSKPRRSVDDPVMVLLFPKLTKLVRRTIPGCGAATPNAEMLLVFIFGHQKTEKWSR